MAKLLTKDEIRALPAGSVLWEEWMCGTEPLKIEIVEHLTRNLIKTKVYIDVFGKSFRFIPMQVDGTETMDLSDKEFRWWDQKPTFDEREETPWNK